MDALIAQLEAAVGGFFGQPLVRILILVGLSYLVLVWLASALWAFIDMRRRSGNPIWPYASAAAVVVASPLLFPLAILIHTVVRPATTVTDRRLERLREEALTAEIDLPRCPRCLRSIDVGWLVCPACRTSLAHQCEHCGHAVALDWDACAWCGSMFGPPAGAVATR